MSGRQSVPGDVDGRALLVFGASVLAMWAHQAVRWDWFIDDAAICFAFARNLVQGHGLVAFPGGERVEGYSDPLYVLILAGFQAIGLDGFQVAKPLGAALAILTGWFSWRLARRAMPEHLGRGGLVAPLWLAASAQFAIWSTSGLENGLFCALLAGAMLRTVAEIDQLAAEPEGSVGQARTGPLGQASTEVGQVGQASTEEGPVGRASVPAGRTVLPMPWSAVLYVLVCWTRPEAVLYAGAGAAIYAWGTYQRTRSASPLVRWLAVLLVPLALTEALRVWYFAWPAANTYYAKMRTGDALLAWDGRGWSQLREWASRLWVGYLAPVYLVGLIGLSDARRLRIGFGAVGAIALVVLWPVAEPPAWLGGLRALACVAAGGLLPLLALGAPGGLARVLVGWTTAAGLWFVVYANGDWMGAYRFVSLVAPALAVLFAVGLAQLADLVERRVSGHTAWGDAGWLVTAIGVGLLLPPNLWQTRDHLYYNINETPASVKQRADYTRSIARRTFWDEPVVNLEIDLGAHLWYNPDYREVDLAMLVDVPLAHHSYQQRSFVREYIFEENPATFGHVGGYWAAFTGLRSYPEWTETMFELPGYDNVVVPPLGWFTNVFARRSMVMTDEWRGLDPRAPPPPARRVGFDWGIVLVGWEQPAPWAPGEAGYLEAPFMVTARREPGTDVQVMAFLALGDAIVASWSLPMGYGLYPMDQWRVGQIFRGRHALAVPPSVQAGTYDLVFVVTGPRGRVIPALEIPAAARTDLPVVAAGEVRFPRAIRVVPEGEVRASEQAVRAELGEAAAKGACERAERTWIRLARHRPEDWTWQDAERAASATPLADCWAGRAENEPDRAVDLLTRAHRWDPDSAALARVGGEVADRLIAEGHSARAALDWDRAYAAYAGVLRFEPWRAWVRRWAEEARDERLGLTNPASLGAGAVDGPRAEQ